MGVPIFDDSQPLCGLGGPRAGRRRDGPREVVFRHRRSGKRESEKTEKGDTYYTSERSYGSFTRAFTLPEGVDPSHIKAELKEGVLTLSVPKKPESQPKKIAVTHK